MRYRRLASVGEVSVLGLGCARLGSVMANRTRRESLSLIAAAVNAGITLFDTADIYAQGESERLLGEALKSTDACIVTKAGQMFPFAERVLFPLRGAAKHFLAHTSQARTAANVLSRARSLPVSTRTRPAAVRSAVTLAKAWTNRTSGETCLRPFPSS